MMRTLHKEKGATLRIEILTEPSVQNFITTHADTLDNAFKTVPMSDAMRRRLQRSDYIFSGIKTFHEINEAFPSLLNTDGTRKPFTQFLEEVKHIDKTYNQHYLAAEFNFAQASAAMAAKWEQYAQDGDRYLLQYRTAGDDRVRPEHASLEGVTLPITDTFWEEFYPPNGWNCRCTVTQVLKSQATPTPHEQAIALGEDALKLDKHRFFRHNSGITGKTFPDYNPYTIQRCRDCDIAKGKLKLVEGFIPDYMLCRGCQTIHECYQKKEAENKQNLKKYTVEEKKQIYDSPLKEQFKDIVHKDPSGHTVSRHQLKDIKQMDYNRVLDTAKLFAKEQNVQILPEIHCGEKTIRNLLGLTGKSNPDLKVGADLIDVKSPFNTKNIVTNANDAAKQGAYACITDHLAFIEETKLKDYARNIFRDPHYTKDTVYFVVNNKLYKITTADISVG